MEVVDLTCPSCGAPANTSQKECEFCHHPIIITSFKSVYDMPAAELNKYANSYKKSLEANPDNSDVNASIAMCYLKLNLYDKAQIAFEKAIEGNFDNSELYFYVGICLLSGKKVNLLPRKDIDKILKYFEAAIKIEPRGIYYFAKAYVKLEYFDKKFLNVTPDWKAELSEAQKANLSHTDVDMLFDIMGIEPVEKLVSNAFVDVNTIEDDRHLSLNDGEGGSFVELNEEKSYLKAFLLGFFIAPCFSLFYVKKTALGILSFLCTLGMFMLVVNTKDSLAVEGMFEFWLILRLIFIIISFFYVHKNNKIEYKE